MKVVFVLLLLWLHPIAQRDCAGKGAVFTNGAVDDADFALMLLLLQTSLPLAICHLGYFALAYGPRIAHAGRKFELRIWVSEVLLRRGVLVVRRIRSSHCCLHKC